jgi:hypothetical protein
MASAVPVVDERARTATRQAYRRAHDLTGHLAELLAALAARPDPSQTSQFGESARLAVGTIVRLLLPVGAASTIPQAATDSAELDAWDELLDELLMEAQAGHDGADDQGLVLAASITAGADRTATVEGGGAAPPRPESRAVMHLPEGVVLRTARKEHTCRQCGEPIRPGERYAEDFNFTAGYQSGHRYHLTAACLGHAGWYPGWTPGPLPVPAAASAQEAQR